MVIFLSSPSLYVIFFESLAVRSSHTVWHFDFGLQLDNNVRYVRNEIKKSSYCNNIVIAALIEWLVAIGRRSYPRLGLASSITSIIHPTYYIFWFESYCMVSRSRGTLVAEKSFLLNGLFSPSPYFGHPVVIWLIVVAGKKPDRPGVTLLAVISWQYMQCYWPRSSVSLYDIVICAGSLH